MCKIDLSFSYFNCCESTQKLKDPFVCMCLSLITFQELQNIITYTNLRKTSCTKYPVALSQNRLISFQGKGMVLYSAVSSPLDRSKRFTLSSPGRPVNSGTVLGFSWKHYSHAAIAQRLFTHNSTTVYSQVLIYTAESTEAS